MINSIVKKYLEYRLRELEHAAQNPISIQYQTLNKIIASAVSSQYPKSFGLRRKLDYSKFNKQLPICDYESIFPLIEKMMLGENNLLTNQKIKWFAKSSGTTNDVSKYIPVSRSFLFRNHIRASWYAAAFVYDRNPNAKIFALENKNLLMGGAIEAYSKNKNVLVGDISGFTITNIPAVGRPFYSPDFKTAIIKDWDLKIKRMTEICSKDSIFLLAGVPTWTIVLFNSILEYTQKKNVLEVWPKLSAYLHGGIDFSPYKEQFQKYIPKSDFHYMEVYNSSEACFAIQNSREDGMLLLTNADVFYEFIPYSEINSSNPNIIPLEAVKTNIKYAIVITNTCGLWRYKIGDVVRFTSTNPYKLKVVGRTKEYINAFGEELMIENASNALSSVCKNHAVSIKEYTVAPRYIQKDQKGQHQWLIEFEKEPHDLKLFSQHLDLAIRKLNSDYDAKRSGDLAVECLSVTAVPKGTFEHWLRKKGKFGGQYKVPKLKNDRSIIDEILNQMACLT